MVWHVRGVSPLIGNEAPVGRGDLPRSLASGSLYVASVRHAARGPAGDVFPPLRGLQVDRVEGTAEAVVISAHSGWQRRRSRHPPSGPRECTGRMRVAWLTAAGQW
jgi:hypothetical protein